jgi:heme-degrading monooxygenase HmoA
MVTELAIIRVKPGCSPKFEAAFASVVSRLTDADGYLRHRLAPTLDEADVYLLQVEWRDLAAHTEVFEPSQAHAQFMCALEGFLMQDPIVVHVPVDTRS